MFFLRVDGIRGLFRKVEGFQTSNMLLNIFITFLSDLKFTKFFTTGYQKEKNSKQTCIFDENMMNDDDSNWH